MAEKRRIERLTEQIEELNARAARLIKEIEEQTKIETAKLTKEIEKETEIQNTKTKITRNALKEIRNRDKLEKHPEETFKRRSRRVELPHLDLRLPWTEVTYTLQPEKTPRCVVQNVNNSTTTKELQKEFEQYGPVLKTEFIYNENQILIHYATVTFENMINATTAARCIDGTRLHSNILRVKQTDSNPVKRDKQLATSTTPNVIQLQRSTDKWTDRFGRRTDNIKELAELLEDAQAISNKRIEQPQPQSPKTPRTSNESTPRRKRSRSRSRSGSSCSSTSIPDENKAKTLQSPPRRSRSRSVYSSSSPSMSDGDEAKTLESPPGWTVTITTQAREKDTKRTPTISGSPTSKEKDRKHQQRRKSGEAAARKTKLKDLDQTRAEKKILTEARTISAEEEKQKTKAANASERTKNKTTTTADAKAEKATTSKIVTDKAYIPNPARARSTKQESNKPSTKRKLPAPEQKKDHGSDTDTIEIKTSMEDSTFAQVEENKLQGDKDKPKYKTMEHHSREMTTKFAQNKTQRWKLNSNDKLENKDGVWRSIGTWILIAKEQEVYIRNNSTGKVLEALKDGKVIKEFEIEGNANQLWTKGIPDDQGFYTLRNLGRQKVLTAISENNLAIKDLKEKAIQWRMAPTPEDIQTVQTDLRLLHQTTQQKDIRKIKDSAIYTNYRRAYRNNQVPKIRMPTLNCYTVQHWQLKTKTCQEKLQSVMEEYNNKKRESGSAYKEFKLTQ